MIDIIYRDDDIVAVNKPSGIKVHRGAYDARRERFVLQLVRDQVGQHLFPVHRLDRPTSGVLVFALNPGAARSLSKSFARRQVRKTYLAVVRGFIAEQGEVDYPLERSETGEVFDKPPRPAVTRFLRLDTVELPIAVGRYASARYSLLKVMPATGRMHQIRRHMSHLRHPVINDRQYGDNKHNRFFSEELNCRRLLLAATELHFPHPRSREETCLTGRLDADFSRIMQRMDWEGAIPEAWRASPDSQAVDSVNPRPGMP